MRAVSAFASGTRHIVGMMLQAVIVVAIVAALVIAAATAAGSAPTGADSVFAAKGGNGNGRGGNSGASVVGGSPSLSLSCDPAPCAVGGRLIVNGAGLTPSSGGQQVFLWVGYPNDFCSGGACHGFYLNPWVADDGSFGETLDNVLLQAGTGQVTATQYNVQRDKWEQVAAADYTVQ